jgi:hypothetical protein
VALSVASPVERNREADGEVAVTKAVMDLAELRRLHESATPGPWSSDDQKRLRAMLLRDADAALIVAMRNALPELLERVERLEAALRVAREEWDAYSDPYFLAAAIDDVLAARTDEEAQ